MRRIILTNEDIEEDGVYSDNFYDVINAMIKWDFGYMAHKGLFIDLENHVRLINISDQSNVEYSLYNVNIQDFMNWYYDSEIVEFFKCKSKDCSMWRYCDVGDSYEEDVLDNFNNIVHNNTWNSGYYHSTDNLYELLKMWFFDVYNEWKYKDIIDDAFIPYIEDILKRYADDVESSIQNFFDEEYYNEVETEYYMNNVNFVLKEIDINGEYAYIL